MSGFAQLAQSPTQRAECAQSCALAIRQFAEASQVAAQTALACAVDPAPSAQAIVSTDNRSRPSQHRPVSACVWAMPNHLRVVCTHRRSAVQQLARRRPQPLTDGRRAHGGRETCLRPVFSESEAWPLPRGCVVAAEGPLGCSGQRACFGCFGARVEALRPLRRGIRARLVLRRGRLVHSLINTEQPQAEAILRISFTKSTDDECLEVVAGSQSSAGPQTEGTEVAFIGRAGQCVDTMKSLPSNPATPKSSSSTESVSTPKHCTSANLSSSSKSSSRSRTGRFVTAGLLAGEGMDPGSILVLA